MFARLSPYMAAVFLPLACLHGAASSQPWTDEDLLNQPGVVSAEYIFDEAPFAQCHASTLVATPSGLVAAWFGGTKERNPDVGIWLSRQVDGKWTAPVEVANGIQYTLPDGSAVRFACWNPVLFLPRQGPLMLFYKCGPSPKEWWGMLMTSGDDGATWSTPRRLPEGILGPIKNKPVQLSDGTILCPSSTEVKTEGNGEIWSVHFEWTDDLGETWSATRPIHDGIKIRAIQPSILFHQDGRLQAVGRTKNDRVFTVWSDDGGKTWGELTLTSVPNPSAGTDAVTLDDGRQLLVYNHAVRRGEHTGQSRSILNVAVSEDGVNWHSALLLERSPGRYSYPAVIQTDDGLVHITYTWRRKRIKHVVIDPAKLELRPMAG